MSKRTKSKETQKQIEETKQEKELRNSINNLDGYLKGLKTQQPPENQTNKGKANPVKAAGETNKETDSVKSPKSSTARVKSPTNRENEKKVESKLVSQRSLQSQKSMRGDSSPKRTIVKKKPLLKEQMPLSEIKARLRKLFQAYTTFGDRTNVAYLKSNKFNKMMADAGLKEVLTNETIDLLFCAENKHKPNMDFDTFLNLLIKVAKAFYKQTLPESEALDTLIRDYLFPLYDKISADPLSGLNEEKMKEELDENVMLVFYSVHPLLMKIYYVYFSIESSTHDEAKINKHQTEKALFVFLKDFDICPAILTKSAAVSVWTEIASTPIDQLTRSTQNPSIIPYLEKDIGAYLTYARFCALLARIAIICYENYPGPSGRKFSNAERLALLLERMELSSGMLNFEQKISSTHNSKISLIVPREVLEKIMAGPEAPEDIITTISRKSPISFDFNWEASMIKEKGLLRDSPFPILSSQTNKSRSKHHSTLSSELDASNKYTKYHYDNPGVIDVFEQHQDALKRVFHYYASYGEPLNHNSMKSIKYQKLMKEAGLVQPGGFQQLNDQSRILDKIQLGEGDQKQLTQIDLDMIFVSLTGNKQMKTLNTVNYDKKVPTPHIGYMNHLHKNDAQVQINGKLDYEGFLKGLELVAAKLFNDLNIVEGVKFIIEKHILKLDEQIKRITIEYKPSMTGVPLQTLIEILKDPEMVGFLGVVHKTMIPYYYHYADTKGLMNFERFSKFAKDFGLFPDIISKGKLLNLFYTLAAVYANAQKDQQTNESTTSLKKGSKTQRAVDQTETELIDQHLFTEALALCALEVPHSDPQPSNVEKVCYLMEKMNKSGGTVLVMKEQGSTRPPTGGTWDILELIKKKYPHIFGIGVETQQPAGFDALMSK